MRAELGPGQEAIWLAQCREPQSTGWIVPGLHRISGALDVPRLEAALSAIVARHEPLRLGVSPDGSAWLREPYAVRLETPGCTWKEALQKPFDLEQEPPFRVQRFAPDLLLFTFHHLAADGWSLTVLSEELKALYSGSPLAALPASYSDYLSWQRGYLDSEAGRGDAAFWRGRLGRRLPSLRVPPGDGSWQNCVHPFYILPEATERLRRAAREAGCSLFTYCLAIYQEALGAVFGQSRVCLCTTVAGRGQARWEPLIGMFANLVPLLADLNGAPDRASLVRQQQQEHVRALERQDYPFALLQRQLERPPQGALGCFEIGFNWLKPHRQHERVGTLGGGVRLSLDSECALESQACTQEEGDFALLLSVVETGPMLSVQLSWRGDRVNLEAGWRLARHLEKELGVAAAWMETKSWQIPASDSPALVGDEPAVTFAQLQRASNRLALELGRLDGQVVALHLSRSFRSVVAMLAIDKAGGIFMPLDPAMPEGRKRTLLADARPALAVSDVPLAGLRTHLPAPHWEGPEEGPVSNGEPLYLLYTSGSTGVPKAVRGTRAGLLNRLRFLPYQSDEIGCHKTSLLFVDSLAELFGPLLAGVPTAVSAGGDLARFVQTHQCTRLTVIPSLLRSLLPSLAGSRLRTVVASGEPLPGPLVHEFRRHLPQARLWNLYGSTEAAGDVTAFDTSDYRDGPVPVGRPLPGCAVECRAGEVWVSGLCLAQGLPVRAGWFQMGDRGRFNSQGELEILGRSDGTRKISGQRVEVGEIEAALREDPGLHEVVVVGSPLRAYYTGAGQPEECLGRHFPAALWPELVRLDEMPRTATGKVDRAALQARQSVSGVADPALVRAIVDLWPLPDARPGLHFFEAGGHSLLAMELVARLEARFGIALGLHRLLQAPTPELQARLVTERSSEGRLVALGPLLAPGLPVWLAPPLGGELLLYRHLVREMAPSFRGQGLRVGKGSVNEEARALAEELRGRPGPHRLAGLSLGGQYVLETARLLREMGEEVAPVLLIDTWAPGCPVRPMGKFEWLLRWLWMRLRLGSLWRRREHPRRPRGKAPKVPAYSPQPYAGEVILLRAWLQTAADPRLGWGDWLSRLEVRPLMGAHGTMLVEPPVARAVAREMQRAWL